MKITISLSDGVSGQLDQLVTSAVGGTSNPSVVLEAALIAFGELSEEQRNRRLREVQGTKKATSREGWLALFWEGLAAEFGSSDVSSGHMLQAVRSYGDFTVVHLMQQPDSDDGGIHIQVQPSMRKDGWMQRPIHLFQFAPSDSPFRTAAQIAAWIQEQETGEAVGVATDLLPVHRAMLVHLRDQGRPVEVSHVAAAVGTSTKQAATMLLNLHTLGLVVANGGGILGFYSITPAGDKIVRGMNNNPDH